MSASLTAATAAAAAGGGGVARVIYGRRRGVHGRNGKTTGVTLPATCCTKVSRFQGFIELLGPGG